MTSHVDYDTEAPSKREFLLVLRESLMEMTLLVFANMKHRVQSKIT